MLTRVATFFAMRSCEYLKVDNWKDRRTKVLCVRNFRFVLRGRILPHTSPYLLQADSVTINFEFQKRDARDDPVTHTRNTDTTMNPVRAAAELIQALTAMGAGPDTPIHNFRDEQNKWKAVTGTAALSILRNFLRTEIDCEALGFTPEDVGLHSIRSSAAMAMHMNDVETYIIMLLGRWSSDAFLRYIHPQVQTFAKGVSQKMIRNEHYFTMPDTHRWDPRVRRQQVSNPSICGRGSSSAVTPINRQFHLGAFNVW